MSLAVREYGKERPTVVLLHGGPGAPGTMAPVARELAGEFHVLEPLQRRSGGKPLTVARHIGDLHEVLAGREVHRAALVGHSWGAMLALAAAAAYPDQVASVAAVGCGTFDEASRRELRRELDARIDPARQERLDEIAGSVVDPDERLRQVGDAMFAVYSVAPTVPALEGLGGCDARGYEETWNDMLRLQAEGVYPAALAGIEAPVLMIHGAADPHPGPAIRASLAPVIHGLEYVELPDCGHYPWLEQAARSGFFSVLREWLLAH